MLTSRSVAGHRRVDRRGPGVDAAPQVVDVGEAFAEQVLGRVLAADAVVAVERDGGVAVEPEQERLAGGVEGARPRDAGERALARRPDVEEQDLAAIEEGLEL